MAQASGKIALVNLYTGRWPVWFPAFLQSCRYNRDVDWVFFTDCPPPAAAPPNVRFIPFSTADFNELATRKLGFEVRLSNPYKACDFKCAFGLIFEEHLKEYEFWGHCDIDVVWGDIRRYVTDEILDAHDVISSRKDVMSGHFALYRNTPELARLFTRYTGYQQLLQHPLYRRLDERRITDTIRSFAERGELRVYWPTYLFNFADPPELSPSDLGRWRNRWRWESGKLYEQTSGSDPKEVMYLHFMTWKRSMLSCNVRLEDDPQSFFVSYSHVGLTARDRPPLLPFLKWKTGEALQGLERLWERVLHRLRAPLRSEPRGRTSEWTA